MDYGCVSQATAKSVEADLCRKLNRRTVSVSGQYTKAAPARTIGNESKEGRRKGGYALEHVSVCVCQ